eukprot:TRINITY_DN13306_c0_g1_i1.p1 TRINITY_DN13306_c0_g1~~TRINITY_DN13306_c0_g1_i1.p1  ORF type:complete len:552 (-),score=67.92 TRINITY_DN13306_c0_g1_i1:95-1750(-)
MQRTVFVAASAVARQPPGSAGGCGHSWSSLFLLPTSGPTRWASYIAEPRQNTLGDESMRNRLANLSPSQFGPRVSRQRWEELKELRVAAAGTVDTNLAAAAEKRRGPIRLDKITAEHVAEVWPPKPVVARPPRASVINRPRHWLVNPNELGAGYEVEGERPVAGVEDVGRFVPITRDDLIELLPEGGCGDLSKDLVLASHPSKPAGLMLRKLTLELMLQLSEVRDAVDGKNQPCIRKAGYLLDGRRGTGKSQVLNLLALWARENGWLVVLEPTPGRYCTEIAEIKRSNNGVYIQNEFAQQFLETTSVSNRHLFESIPVDMKAYGSRSLDGEPLVQTKRLYGPVIEKTVDADALTGVERLRRIADYKKKIRVPSMIEVLSEPTTVWDIVEFGLENDAYATQAVAEMFVQLQRQTTHPVLVLVDSWNECFPCSQYVSIRYDNTRFNGYIPGYHLTMPRMFHRWDGHLYRRGLKICATSWARTIRRDYKPELLGVKDFQLRTVRNFTQVEFANYVMHLQASGTLHNFPAEDLDHYFMLTGGNGWQARRTLTTLY